MRHDTDRQVETWIGEAGARLDAAARMTDALPGQTTDADAELAVYMRALAAFETAPFCYRGLHDFILRHGRFWTAQPLPEAYDPMLPKLCFDNAYRLAMRRRGLRFVEGVALGVIPMHHAWLVDADGRVIDPTWASTRIKYRDENIGSSYFGVAFSLADVRAARNARRGADACLSVLNNWANSFAIMRQPFTEREP